MIIMIECLILCGLFTIMVLLMSKDPIRTLYNYPPKIQERVKKLDEYKDKIPTNKNKIFAKTFASLIIIIIVSLIMRYINNYHTFKESIMNSYLIWTIVNLYDVFIIDICWFCQSPKFIFKGTEDMKNEYKNYWYHIKEGLIGQVIGFILCLIVSLIVTFIL